MKLFVFKLILLINYLVASFSFSDVVEISNAELKSLLEQEIPLKVSENGLLLSRFCLEIKRFINNL